MDRLVDGIVWRMVLISVLAAGTAACTTYYRDGPPLYSPAYYHYPYRYHYYPSTRIYFHLSSGDYYYRDANYHWKRVKQLPPKYNLDQRDRVHLWIDADRPHARHREHHKKYKPHPEYRRDAGRDREERRHNRRQHERYRQR